MANTEVIGLIIDTAQDYFIYMLPIIGVMTGLIYITSFLFAVTLGAVRRTFRG